MNVPNHALGARVSAALVGAVTIISVAACSSSSTGGTASPVTTASSPAGTTQTVATSACGTKPGVKATGTPISLGGIDTDQPGVSFTDIGNMAAAYFACVNANGGINGHPISYTLLTEQTNPSQIAAQARQLVQTDHVVGIVGNQSVLECTVDHAYWEQLGYYIIDSGIAPECWSTPNSAAVNMGPRFSSDGAIQYALSQHVSKVVLDQGNLPGVLYAADGGAAITGAAHVPIVQMTENLPIAAANSVAIKEVNAAGPDGAVVLDFTPPQALVILQAAQKLGLANRVKLWGCSTPCNTDYLAKALGPQWNHKLFVNAELTPADTTNTPTMNLYKAILAQYGKNVSGGVGSFSQFGFVEAEVMVHALESVKGAYTVQSVNAAIKGVSNFDTWMLCQPWTYGGYPMHIPNNEDYTTTPDNGQMVLAQGCTAISSADPQIAAYRKLVGG